MNEADLILAWGEISAHLCDLTDELARSATSYLSQSAPLPGLDVRFGINWKF